MTTRFARASREIRIQSDDAGGYLVIRRAVNGLAKFAPVAHFTGRDALRKAHECAVDLAKTLRPGTEAP